MSARRPLLLEYTSRTRQRLPDEGQIACPASLVRQVTANGLELAVDTLTDGNCALHAFGISYLNAAKRYKIIANSAACKKFQKPQNSRDPKSMTAYLRDVATTWLFAHGSDIVWEGLTVKDMARSMGNWSGTFQEYIVHMRVDGRWADALMVHALACSFGVDVAVFQNGMDQTLLGVSLLPALNALKNTSSASDSEPQLICMVLVNDLHWWGLRSKVAVKIEVPENGDWMRHSFEQNSAEPEAEDGDECPAIDMSPSALDSAEVEAELSLCKALGSWNPWATPDQEVTDALVALASVAKPGAPKQPDRCALRAHVMKDLAHEIVAENNLPASMRWNGLARYRLRSGSGVCAKSYSGGRRRAAVELIESHVLAVEDIEEKLAFPCWRGRVSHECFTPFRAQPGLVRNWRILWRSMPASTRREALLEMFRRSLVAHRAKGEPDSQWKMEFTLLGIRVCENAFQTLSGISSYALNLARTEALKGSMSSLSRGELGMGALIKNTNHDKLYLDSRLWIERYAEEHSEQSPISGKLELPAGRKSFYYAAYREERRRDRKPFASQRVFETAWQCECDFVVIVHSVCKFTICGFCMFFKRQLDLTPRWKTSVIEALRARLGQHFSFQSAQRLAEARIEEICDQSQGRKWIMHIDKMDQTTTIVPQVWNLAASPLMKLGSRLVAGVIGSMWHGPKETRWHCRTVFEDCTHGSDMQCSAALLNLHEVAMKESHLPEEFYIGADNTPKETKNTFFVFFLIWLLCNLDNTPLWLLTLLFLLVGHTHNGLDRFFSRLSVALTGRDYFDLDEMWGIVHDVLKAFEVQVAHLNTVWDWKAMEKELSSDFTRFERLNCVHMLSVYRDQEGVWVKWKQYMTDEAWSRPILLVKRDRMAAIAAYRPKPLVQEFAQAAAMQSWANKLEVALTDQGATATRCQRSLNWFRDVVAGKDVKYRARISLDQIVSDLKALGNGMFAGPVPLQAAPMEYPPDVVASLFPGADHPVLPVDALVRIQNAWEPELAPVAFVPGSLVICKAPPDATFQGRQCMLFMMGMLLPYHGGHEDDRVCLEWWVPSQTPRVDFKKGRKALTLDIFAAWRPLDSINVEERREFALPDCLVKKSDVLMHNIELENDKLQFKVFDSLRAEHNIDCTALSVSQTQGGNAYRTYVQVQ